MLGDDTTPTPEPTAESAPAPRRRRAASRPAGPPTAPQLPVEPAESAPEAAAAPAPATEPSPTAGVPAAEPEAPSAAGEAAPAAPAKRASRARSRRAVAEPAASEPSDAAVAEAAVAEAAAEAPAAKPARTSRRRKATPVAEPEPAADEAVAASLAELEQRASTRRRSRAGSFGLSADVDPDAVLSSLAAAIGAGSAADAVAETLEAEPEAETSEEEVVEEATETDAEDTGEPAAEDADAEPAGDEADDDEHDDEAQDGEDTEEGAGGTRRRRRRRGGRRRRRSPGSDEDTAGAESEAGDEEEDSADAESAETGEGSSSETGGRRRRRRRRRGEDVGDAEDDPGTEVVVRVREPRRSRSASDEVTGIEGSTRMEAKKQRRREGRAAGRRRSPVLSEAEFLARRESVDRVMLIRQAEDYSQIAVLEDGILVEHYVDRASATSMIGNIYLGRVQNVLPSMEAAFIDIGRGRNAVLYAGEVDWASFGVTGQDKKVEKVFKSGQTVLVQVTKDPVGAKGARLTSHVSIPGRYLVYSPGGQLSGISRKLPENERKRLKTILDDLIGPDASVIIRTAAEGASEEELVRDVNRLKAQWEVIEKKTGGSAPSLLYAEPDLTVRIVRDLFTEDFASLVVDGNGGPGDAWETVEAYVSHVAPHLADRLKRWDRTESGDLFSVHRVHEQVAKALERKVFLPSGGSLIIDRTEAMTVIDVNTGRFTGTTGNLEATVTSNNLEAAEEIVRQLRLRDIGGIIVIDFIDMVLPSNRELLLRRLVECLGRDRTRHQVAEVTSLGLVQMTRKKIGTGLAEAFTVPCETCKGRGYHTHDVPVATQVPADGGDRENGRRGRGGQGSQRSARGRRSGVAPELAAVVAATLGHSAAPESPSPAEPAPAAEPMSPVEPALEDAGTEAPVAETVDVTPEPVDAPVAVDAAAVAEVQPELDAAPAEA